MLWLAPVLQAHKRPHIPDVLAHLFEDQMPSPVSTPHDPYQANHPTTLPPRPIGGRVCPEIKREGRLHNAGVYPVVVNLTCLIESRCLAPRHRLHLGHDLDRHLRRNDPTVGSKLGTLPCSQFRGIVVHSLVLVRLPPQLLPPNEAPSHIELVGDALHPAAQLSVSQPVPCSKHRRPGQGLLGCSRILTRNLLIPLLLLHLRLLPLILRIFLLLLLPGLETGETPLLRARRRRGGHHVNPQWRLERRNSRSTAR
mmetsp:Transcript_41870/g.102176  ORF Transcript_41870/g.102176 Transcript_41870/m.102176 type:complete len:254 (+) Transcript_41870:952-1713(+)